MTDLIQKDNEIQYPEVADIEAEWKREEYEKYQETYQANQE